MRVSCPLTCLSLLLAVSLTAGAQEVPQPAESPAARPSPASGPPPAAGPAGAPAGPPAGPGKPGAKPAAPALNTDEIHVRAETQETDGKGHYLARGFVDLQSGDIHLQADKLDLYETDQPDGTKKRRLVAEGNVVFLRGEERLSGRRLTMDLDSYQGTFEDAVGYVQPGVFIEAKTIERVDADTYRFENGKFTSCAQPNPRWGFSASSARIDVDDKIVARNAVFKVKSVPAFYSPYFLYPIKHGERSTGFLFPHFGYSNLRGFNVGEGFFWAMGRSYDQLFYLDNYSRFGFGLGHEFRYLEQSPSRGDFKTYALRPQVADASGARKWQYDIDWNALQLLPGNVKGSLRVRQYSDIFFQRQVQDSFNLASTRTRSSAASLQRTFGSTTVALQADSTDTFFGDQTRVNRHLPSLRVARTSTKFRKTGLVFDYEAKAEGLVLGDAMRVDRYSRFDVAPRLSRPFATSFLQVTPRVQVEYTHYGARQEFKENGNPVLGRAVPGSLERRFFEGNLEMRGPTFSKVFDNPFGFYSERIKHVIGPEVTYTYRTRVDQFNDVPKFDGTDYLLGTNQIQYALVQRLLGKRAAAPGAKLTPYEFLSWRLGQTYYVNINDGQNEFDPNYSSAFFGKDKEPKHYSPLQSQVRFRPVPAFSASFNTEYDISFRQVRTMSLFGNLSTRRVAAQAGYNRSTRPVFRDNLLLPANSSLRGSARVEAVPKSLVLEGGADYDIIQKNLLHSWGRLKYSVQCCGFSAELIQYNYQFSSTDTRKERQFRFSIELANIGAVGSMNGVDRGQQPGSFK